MHADRNNLEWVIKTANSKIIATYAALSKKANSVGVFAVNLECRLIYYMNFVMFLVVMMQAWVIPILLEM